jgi:ATP-dependent helicase HrpB
MAQTLGEEPGETIGYVTRLDTKRSGRTRVVVMTEAIFVATILSDPELSGVSAVLFDEAHERHLDSDLGLALALEAQGVLREDLRVVVMSATLDGARFSALMPGARVIESEGKAHPLEIRWLGASPQLRTDQAMANAVVQAWQEQTGDILGFLPGVRDIERTADLLAQRLPSALILPLHGQVEPAGQRAAIRRDAQGRRRIVLATAIAETSLTLDGVCVVVDAGLSRRAEFDKVAGVTRLVTTRASQAAAAQRAGRAARQGPGVAYRLWEEAAHAGRAAFDPPEMLTSDLAPLALTLAQWGRAIRRRWRGSIRRPRPRWRRRRPRWPRSARSTGKGGSPPMAGPWRACRWSLRSPTCCSLLRSMAQRRRPRGWPFCFRSAALAAAAKTLPGAMIAGAATAAHGPKPRASWPRAGHRRRSVRLRAGRGTGWPPLGVLLAEAFPDRIARPRAANGEEWLSSGGRGYRLDPASPLVTARWLVIGDAQGEAKGARIMAGLALDDEDVSQWLAHRMEQRHTLTWNAQERRVEARLERRLGAIVLGKAPDPRPDPAEVAALLIEVVRREGLDALPLGKAARALIERARYAGLEGLEPQTLLDEAEDWLAPLLKGHRDLDLPAGRLHEALLDRLDWNARSQLDRLAPGEFRSPAGTTHAIDYAHEGGPAVELRVQALFGLDRHPTIGQTHQPLLLSLTSPAGRPIQTTADLPAFWRGSWRDVVKDMKGRYPRHRWPDQPWAEDPSLKTRNAFEASRKK